MNLQENVTKLSTSPTQCHYTTLWSTTCVSLFITTVMQGLNIMTKLTVTDKHITKNVQSVCLWLWHMRIKTILPLINAWSVMLCWIPERASIITWGTLAECLCVWCIPLTSAKCGSLCTCEWVTEAVKMPWCCVYVCTCTCTVQCMWTYHECSTVYFHSNVSLPTASLGHLRSVPSTPNGVYYHSTHMHTHTHTCTHT